MYPCPYATRKAPDERSHINIDNDVNVGVNFIIILNVPPMKTDEAGPLEVGLSRGGYERRIDNRMCLVAQGGIIAVQNYGNFEPTVSLHNMMGKPILSGLLR
jgi:hypothetical protein